MPQEEDSDGLNQLGVTQQVVDEVRAHSATCEQADAAVEARRRVSGTLQCLPGDFIELSVLRIEDRSLFRAEAEEFRIELIHVLQHHALPHVVRVGERRG